MTRDSLPRIASRAILRIHPAPFHDRFAEEMLWIFDEERKQGETARLLLDGAVSVLRQHAKDQDDLGAKPAAFATGIEVPAMSIRRLVQGGVMATILTYGFIFCLGRNGALAGPRQVHAASHSCSPVLCAPSRIKSPPPPPENARIR